MANYAMVVGIDGYAMPGAALGGAVRDALDFATWLIDGGAVAPGRLLLALGRTPASPDVPDALSLSLRPGNATYAQLSELLGRLKTLVVEGGAPADRLFFYFAGHGIAADSRGERVDGLCASDFTSAVPSLSFTTDSIEAHLRTIPAREQYLFYDACRSIPANPRMRLGEYDLPDFGTTPYPPQFVLKATAIGGEAVEVDEGGAFTQTLLAGLRDGAGSAKTWNEAEAAFDVRWRRLCGYVAECVGKRLPPGSDLRVPQESGERAAGSDPVLSRFAKDRIPDTVLTLRSDPVAPAFGVQLRRTLSFDPPADHALGTGTTAITLPQGDYLIRGACPSYDVAPPQALIELYDPTEFAFALTPTVVTPPAPASVIGRGLSELIARTVIPGAVGFALAETIDRHAVAKRSSPRTPPPDRPLVVDSHDPLARIGIATLADVPVATGAGRVETAADEPAYRISAMGPDGAATTRVVQLVDQPDWFQSIDPPSRPSDATRRAARRAGLTMRDGTLIVPGLPPIGTPDLATLAAIGAAQAVAGGGGYAEAMGIVHGRATGLHVVAIDEADDRTTGAAFRQHGRLRLWQQRVVNAGERQAFVRAVPTMPEVVTAAFASPSGAYWLDCRDYDRQRRAGFKLSTAILPGRVTVVIVHRRHDGTINLYQMAIDRTARVTAAMDCARLAMFVQRRRQSRLLAIDDPATRGLIDGDWFEPMSAAVAAWLALRLYGDAEMPAVRALATRLVSAAGPVDAAMLAARIDGGPDALTRAVARQVSPVIDDALGYAVEQARAMRLFGFEQRWLEEKGRQSVRHRLWMMRREDDVKRAGMPQAIG